MRTYQDQPSGTVDELRRMRREASEPERRLLRALKESFPALKWRHQSPVGVYRVDMLCFHEKLVIEVDGDTHASTQTYDAIRSRYIERRGYRVIRLANADVMQNLDGVIAQIALSLREREGAAQRRKGEGDRPKEKGEPACANSPSPSHAAARRGPLPLPRGEEK